MAKSVAGPHLSCRNLSSTCRQLCRQHVQRHSTAQDALRVGAHAAKACHLKDERTGTLWQPALDEGVLSPVKSAYLTVSSLCGNPGGCCLQALALLLQDIQLDDLEGLVVMWDAPRTAKPAGAALADSMRPCPVCCGLVRLTLGLDLYAAKAAANKDLH